MEKAIVPSEFKVGYNNRHDTYNGKLGYMIYANKADGTFGQQTSFDNWINKGMPVETLKNDYMLGFVLNKGMMNRYRFGASARFRVFHPHGFEFEISLENLSMILAYTTVSAGDINVPCRIGWVGKNCILMPKMDLGKAFEIEEKNIGKEAEKQKEKEDKKKQEGKPIPLRSLIDGKIVENKNGERFYISKPTYTNQKKELKQTFAYCRESELKDGEKLYNLVLQQDVKLQERFFYPLNGVTGKALTQEEVSGFYSFVEAKDLTSSEAKQYEYYLNNLTPFFKNDFVPKSFDGSMEKFKKLMNLSFDDNRNYYNHDNNSMNKTMGHIVKRDDIAYLITTYQSAFNGASYGNRLVKETEQFYLVGEKDYNYGFNAANLMMIPIVNLLTNELESKNIVVSIGGRREKGITEEMWNQGFADFNRRFHKLNDAEIEIVKRNLLIATDFES